MTVQCPRGHRCESCGQEHRLLSVLVVETPAGPVCVTLCPGCGTAIAGGMELPITVGTASRLAQQHREHIGLVPFVCPACTKRSYHPRDAAEGYCGSCHAFTGAVAVTRA